MSPLRQLLWAGLCLCLLPLGVLWPAVFGGQAFVPFDSRIFPPESLALSADELAARRAGSNFDITEKTLLCLHELRFARQELQQGRFPAWNPYARGGAPLYANALNGLANPLFLPHLLVDPEHAFAWTAWLAMALAGILMLGFLRELGLALPAAVLGAVLFTWSGTMVANAHFFMRYAALLFLPGSFWALERLRKGSGPGAAVGLAATVALSWTAGFPPYALAATLVAGAWLLVVVAQGPERGRKLLWGSAGFALGIGLSCVQLLPMLGYFPESQRDLNPDPARLPGEGLDPMGWLGFFLPDALGRPDLNVTGAVPYEKSPLCWLLFSRAGGQAQPAFNATEYAVYLGVLPLLFLAQLRWRGRGPFAAFALGAALVLVLVSTGGLCARALYAVLPPVRATPPMRFIGPVAFLLAGATALGFDAWLRPGEPRRRPVPWVAGLLVVVLAAALAGAVTLPDGAQRSAAFLDLLESRWGERFRAIGREDVLGYFAPVLAPAARLLLEALLHVVAAAVAYLLAVRFLPRSLAAWAVPLLAAAELLSLAPPFVPCHPAAGRPHTEAHEFLRERRKEAAAEGGFTVARVSPPGTPVPELPSALPANSLFPERIRDLNSYAFVDGRSHLLLRKLYGPEFFIREYWLKALPDDTRLELPLFDLLGVKYLLCLAPPASQPVQHAGREAMPPRTAGEGTFHVFERPHPCPRAFVVPRAEPVESDDRIVERLVAPQFDPRAAALVRADELAALPAPLASGSGTPGTVRFVRDEPATVELEVRGSGGGLLLLADTFMSGWRAEVDGKAAPIVRADLCFRAVPIPAGDSRVVLRYSAPLLVPGAGVTAVALLVCAGLLVLARRSSPRAHHTSCLG